MPSMLRWRLHVADRIASGHPDLLIELPKTAPATLLPLLTQLSKYLIFGGEYRTRAVQFVVGNDAFI
jgi:hypothetical protein